MERSNRYTYAQRLTRDIADVLSHDFTSSSAILNISTSSEISSNSCGLNISLCVLEGPYRGGHFLYYLEIPEHYPFRPVEIWSKTPTWHPNIDIRSGKVSLPLQWCPVLSLVSIGVAIQMIMLEPSAEYPLNLEACSYYCGDPNIFDAYVQHTLRGCIINGIALPPMHDIDCRNCHTSISNISSLSSTPDPSYHDDDNSNQMSIVGSDILCHGKKRSNHIISSLDTDSIHIQSFEPCNLCDSSNMDEIEDGDDTENFDILQRFKRMKYSEDG